ncbi:MAG: M14 family metallopeptidase [Bacteroidales bacterium]|nr:M14 family metallopeptidase [Bacteroidales bacterium]MDZ4205081.1 M14 family metallopeptidase [Bacteroidales bacterium]
MNRFLICGLLLVYLNASAHDPKTTATFATWYESSGYLETPRYDETVRYCRQLAEASPIIHYTSYGMTPQGREISLLIASKDSKFTPQMAQNSGKAILLIQACIHPGEPDGKDAGLMLLRDMAIKHQHEELLDHVTILFIPIVNPDGHERFGPYSRINQNGPKEMGWRATAQNYNLNRDHVKADAPEMRAWLRLFNEWIPDFFIDIHTTDGADYQYTLTYSLETFGNMDKPLTQWQLEVYEPYIQTTMTEAGFPIFQYVQFRNWHDPRSGMRSGVAPPMYSQGYTSTRNRPGMLIETHMLKDYKTRVSATYNMLIHTLELLNKEYKTLKTLVRNADQHTTLPEFRKEPYPLGWRISTTDSVMVNFLGVEYDIRQSDLTGGPWFVYKPDRPNTYNLPWFNNNIPTSTALLPEAYIIPVEWSTVIERMAAHGVQMHRLSSPLELDVESYRFSNTKWRPTPYEGHHTVTFDQEEITQVRHYMPGSVIIDMNQPAAGLIAHMLEPKSNDSFLYWGFFNAIFEQKEYAETYVMEPLAREMMTQNPELRREFEAHKAANPVYARNQFAILNWFYSRTPYWDRSKDVYPVGKITDRNIVDMILD